MALTQEEKSVIFMLIQNNKLSAQRNDEIRGNDEGARLEIAHHAPEILRLKQEVKQNNENQKAAIESEIAKLEVDIAVLTTVLATNQ
jgi:hypothetical protein